jgi:isoamylase
MLATLLLSEGTPMILAGDEFARTQSGNNNAYCQDNEISWVDWDLLGKNGTLVNFIRGLTALRHKYPILRRNLFLNGQYVEDLGIRDVTWVSPAGTQMSEEDWHGPNLRAFGTLLDGRAPASNLRQCGKEATILILINGGPDPVAFTLPKCNGAQEWSWILDTFTPDIEGRLPVKVGETYTLKERSLVAFAREAGSCHPSEKPAS